MPNSKPVVDGLHDAGLRPGLAFCDIFLLAAPCAISSLYLTCCTLEVAMPADSRNGKRVEVTSGLSLPLGHAAQPVKGGYAAAAAKQPPPPVPARPPASPKRAGPSAAGAGLPLSAGSTPPKPCRTPPRPRNGHRVVLRSEALARIIPHLQGVGGEPGASGALAETPGSEVLLSGLSLNQGWESPVAIPRSGFRSACATPTSTSSSSRPLLPSSPEPELDLPQPPVLDGAIPSPFLQTEEEEGHKQQPSAQEQRQRPERGKLRRRWSADLDCTDSSDCGPDQSPRCLETPSWPKHTDGSGHWLEMETGASQSIPPTDQTTQPLEPLLQMKATSSSRPVHCFIEKTGGAAEEKPKPLRGPSRSPAEVTGHQDLTPERRPPMASAAPPESRAAGHIESSPPWEPDVGSSPGASSVTASECSNNSEEGGGFDSSIPVAKHLQTDLERLLVQVIPMIDLEAGARMASQRKIGNLTLVRFADSLTRV